jgi:hypothetical protein
LAAILPVPKEEVEATEKAPAADYFIFLVTCVSTLSSCNSGRSIKELREISTGIIIVFLNNKFSFNYTTGRGFI